ncbi:MAG: cyclodeaminase/cyclohydrolase family protein [Elusimicrobiota bacterium]
MSEKPQKYLNSSVKEYLDNLSAKLPTPGGGSAAALVSATGVSCLLMVVNFTVDKKGYEQYNDEIKEILEQLTTCKLQLTTLIDGDVLAYTVFTVACKLSKNTDAEIKIRNEKIQSALKNSLLVLCKIFEISVSVLPLAKQLLDIGNKNLLSDVACGVSFLRAGIESAKFNIDINLKFIDDVNFKKEAKIKYKKIMKNAFIKIEKIIKKVEAKL